MRSALDIGENEESTKAQRIAALRRAVEGLQSIPTGIQPEHMIAGVGASLAPGLPGPGFIGGVLNEAIAARHDQPAAFGFLFALTAAALQGACGPGCVRCCAARLGFRSALRPRPQPVGRRRRPADPGRYGYRQRRIVGLEEALRSEARPAIVAGVIEAGLDLTQSRRLNLAAATHATPLVLLRGAKVAGTSAAATRWRIAPAPAALDRFDTFAYWRWHVALERCRNGRTGEWLIEWDPCRPPLPFGRRPARRRGCCGPGAVPN